VSAVSSFSDREQVRNPLFAIYFHCEGKELLGQRGRIVANRLGLKPLDEALAELLACGPSIALRQFVIAVLIRARDTVHVQPRHIARLAADLPDPQPELGKLASNLSSLLLDRERYSSRQALYAAAMVRMTGRSFEGYDVTREQGTLKNNSGIVEMLLAVGS
jgi:hypothetical protein